MSASRPIPYLFASLLTAACMPGAGSDSADPDTTGSTEGTVGDSTEGTVSDPTSADGTADGATDTEEPPAGDPVANVFVVRAEGDIYVEADGPEAEQTRLLAVPVLDDGSLGTDVIDVAGTLVRGFGFLDRPEAEPSFSPDESTVAWISADDGGLYVRPADLGGDAIALTPGEDLTAYWWNPPGTWIAALGSGTLVLAAVDGSQAETFAVTIWPDDQPQWSADGSTLVAVADGELRVLGTDGTDTAIQGTSIAVSADGSRIAYSFSNDVYVADSDGSNATLVDTGAEVHASPDGARFVYGALGTLTLSDFQGVLPETIGQSGFSGEVWWSPDSQLVAYTVGLELWLANADGPEDVQLLTGNGALPTQVQWRNNGAELTFVGDGQMYFADVTGATMVGDGATIRDSQWLANWALWVSETGADMVTSVAAAPPEDAPPGPSHAPTTQSAGLLETVNGQLEPNQVLVDGAAAIISKGPDMVAVAMIVIGTQVGKTWSTEILYFEKPVDELSDEDQILFQPGGLWSGGLASAELDNLIKLYQASTHSLID